MTGGQLQNAMTKIAATAVAGAATILSTIRMAFAASTGGDAPQYDEVLRLAQEKVHAATQPGAIGNGVPVLADADPMAMLPWIGIAVAVAITAVLAAKILAPKSANEALTVRQ
jgi:hypothetical protein